MTRNPAHHRSCPIIVAVFGYVSCMAAAMGQQVLYVKADATGANDGTSWADAYTDLQDALAEVAPPAPAKNSSHRPSSFPTHQEGMPVDAMRDHLQRFPDTWSDAPLASPLTEGGFRGVSLGPTNYGDAPTVREMLVRARANLALARQDSIRKTRLGLRESARAEARGSLQENGSRATAMEPSIEIWVAAGTYTPDRGTGDRFASFEMTSNVGLYGGFAGWETRHDQHDPATNETTLSGDLLGNDDPDEVGDSTCCWETGEFGCDNQACQDAVCAVNPFCCDPDAGGGWRSHCVYAAEVFCCDLCHPTRCDNSYTVVVASEVDAPAVLDGFTISDGEANRLWQEGDEDGRSHDGGGIYSRKSAITIYNCMVADNMAWGWGSGWYDYKGTPNVSDSTFIGNSGGGGAAHFWISEPTLTNCTFRDTRMGAGMASDGSQPITGCKFIGNSGVGLYLGGGAPNIVDCAFADNGDSGMQNDGYPQLVNCRFHGNHNMFATGGGLSSRGPVILVNCIFSGNTAGCSGGLALESSALVINCTIAGNYSPQIGGMSNQSSETTLAHCILWGNWDDGGMDEWAQFYYDNHNPPVVRYSSIQDWTGALEGPGNVNLDPLFVDPLGPDGVVGTEDDDLHLSPYSPLINAGDPDPPLLPYLDHDGHVRTLCGIVDMGAYEFGIGDYNCTQSTNLRDFAWWESCMTGPEADEYDAGCEAFDFDADDNVDLLDFAGFQSELQTEPSFLGTLSVRSSGPNRLDSQ